MKLIKKSPLLVLLAVSIVIYGILAGVPKLLLFAQKQMKQEEYRVEEISDIPAEDYEVSGNALVGNVSGNGVSANQSFDKTVSVTDISGSDDLQPVSGADYWIGNVIENQFWDVSISAGDYVFSAAPVDYFKDALFIGDSRTVGLSEYAQIDGATYYASTGLTVYKVFDSKIVPVEGSKTKITVEEALKTQKFGKIYFMIGINEMGTGNTDSFMEEYESAVEHLRQLQPEAIIYVQAIMNVTQKRSDKGDYITNEGIKERNERIAKLADNEHIFFLNVNPAISDETGGMNPLYTFDGVHLKAEYIPIWVEYLARHVIQKNVWY